MFLTRLGFGSKIVVTGDVTQIDLPEGRGRSGLLAVRDILEGIERLAFVELGSDDVVRHKIVQDIVDAYETNDVTSRATQVDSVRSRRAVGRRGRRPALGPAGAHGARPRSGCPTRPSCR